MVRVQELKREKLKGVELKDADKKKGQDFKVIELECARDI